jgi:hypothetical protein
MKEEIDNSRIDADFITSFPIMDRATSHYSTNKGTEDLNKTINQK